MPIAPVGTEGFRHSARVHLPSAHVQELLHALPHRTETGHRRCFECAVRPHRLGRHLPDPGRRGLPPAPAAEPGRTLPQGCGVPVHSPLPEHQPGLPRAVAGGGGAAVAQLAGNRPAGVSLDQPLPAGHHPRGVHVGPLALRVHPGVQCLAVSQRQRGRCAESHRRQLPGRAGAADTHLR
ncbi:hypothetical protein D3C75_822800 [compost metagenome]